MIIAGDRCVEDRDVASPIAALRPADQAVRWQAKGRRGPLEEGITVHWDHAVAGVAGAGSFSCRAGASLTAGLPPSRADELPRHRPLIAERIEQVDVQRAASKKLARDALPQRYRSTE